MHILRVPILLGIAVLTSLSGCGGGTYGTGGSSPVYARAVDASGAPVPGVIAVGVATSERSVSDQTGLLVLPLNESFPLAPVQFTEPQGQTVIRYLSTSRKAPARDPLKIQVRGKLSGGGVQSRGDAVSCIELLDSWRSALSDPAAHFTDAQRSHLSGVLSRPSATLDSSCEETVSELERVGFGANTVVLTGED